MTARFRLREMLEAAGMSQTQLARDSGVSFATVNRICTNATEQVSLKTLDAIAAVLGIQPGDLIEGEKSKRGKRG